MSDRIVNLAVVSKALSKVISDSCNGRSLNALDYFPEVISLLGALPGTAERFEAFELAIEIADRGFENAAERASCLINESLESLNEGDDDLAVVCLEKAVSLLEAVADTEQCVKAIALTKKISLTYLSNENLEKMRELLGERFDPRHEADLSARRKTVLEGLLIQ